MPCELAVTTLPATSITGTSAKLHGRVDTDCGEAVSCAMGWGKSVDLTDWASVGSYNAGEEYEYNLGGLEDNTTYYFRTKGTNSIGVTYGSILNFTTGGAIYPSIPTIRATGLVHRFSPGNYTLETILGSIRTAAAVPSYSLEPAPTLPPRPPPPREIFAWNYADFLRRMFEAGITGTTRECVENDYKTIDGQLHRCVSGKWIKWDVRWGL